LTETFAVGREPSAAASIVTGIVRWTVPAGGMSAEVQAIGLVVSALQVQSATPSSGRPGATVRPAGSVTRSRASIGQVFEFVAVTSTRPSQLRPGCCESSVKSIVSAATDGRSCGAGGGGTGSATGAGPTGAGVVGVGVGVGLGVGDGVGVGRGVAGGA